MYHPRRDDRYCLTQVQTVSLKHGAVAPALEGAAVHTALVGRILLMRSYLNAVKRAVVFVAAVVFAVFDAAVDTMVCLIVVEHLFHLKMICAGIPTGLLSALYFFLCTDPLSLNMM